MAIKIKPTAPPPLASNETVVTQAPAQSIAQTYPEGAVMVGGQVVGQATPGSLKFKPGSFLAQKMSELAQVPQEQAQLPATPKAKQEQQVVVSTEVQALTAELVDLNAKMVEYGAYDIAKRIDELKTLLQAVAKDMDPSKPAVFESPEGGTVVFSAAKSATTITDKPQLIKLMGTAEYIEASKITLGDAKKYLSEIELAKCTTTGFGSRSLQSVTSPKA